MRQAIHIFLKDVMYLRYEIGLVLLLIGSFAWLAARWPLSFRLTEMLVLAGSAFLIIRVIHAEPIPGDRQFWVTRPYRWKSLLAAKLAFVVVFIQIPVVLAHTVILLAHGFDVLANLPGLMWTQCLIAVGILLPVAALASMTSSIVQLLPLALLIVAVSALFARVVPHGMSSLGPVDWVRNSVALAILFAIGVATLFFQYKSRRTFFSRTLALSMLVLGGIAYLSVPWAFAFELQSRLSKQAFDTSGLEIAFDPVVRLSPFYRQAEQLEVFLPILLTGVPSGEDVRADSVAVTLTNAAGRKWTAEFSDSESANRTESSKGIRFQESQLIDRGTYEAFRDSPLTARISLYLTAFGNPRARTIPLQQKPVNVLDGLQCYTLNTRGGQGDVYCSSAFRWPARMVDARVGGGGARTFTRFISYSPFPANLGLNPVETRWASPYTSMKPSADGEVTITVKEPLAHARRDFELRDVRLRYEARRSVTSPR
jgi:hypothetical protein